MYKLCFKYLSITFFSLRLVFGFSKNAEHDSFEAIALVNLFSVSIYYVDLSKKVMRINVKSLTSNLTVFYFQISHKYSRRDSSAGMAQAASI